MPPARLLSPSQLELAHRRLRNLPARLDLAFDPGTERADGFGRALGEVLNSLASVSDGRLVVRESTAVGYPGRPSATVRNAQFLAVPAGPELEPFLALLESLARAEEDQTAPAAEEDARHAAPLAPDAALPPALVEVLIAPTCPSCPAVVTACAVVAAAHQDSVRLAVIDAQRFPDLAGSCRSVPTVLVDRTRALVGSLRSEELLEVLAERGAPGFGPRALASLVEASLFSEAVPLLYRDGGLSALADLFEHGTMQQRMGTLLLADEALQGDPHALDGALPLLLPLLDSTDPVLRGDTADLLGRIGAPGARDALERLAQDGNADVREAADEALERLRQPS